MGFGTWLVWSSVMNFVAGVHADADRLRTAARSAGVPEIVMEGIAAVETGYRGGNEFFGKAGEVGRMQIMAKTAEYICAAPVNLADYDYNITCGAKILRHCRDKYKEWSLGIRCYQGMAVPEMTKDYLLKVQREIGRLTLAKLDEQAAAAAARAKARVKAKKAARPKLVVQAPADSVQTVAQAIIQNR